MRTNRAVKTPPVVTHEGGRANSRQSPLVELQRAVATCLLWEDTFYEKGDAIAARIASLCDQVSMQDIANLAVKARHDWRLRHVPLWLLVQLFRRHSMPEPPPGAPIVLYEPRQIASTVSLVVSRPDEAAELVGLYWKANGGRKMLPRQMKKGLGLAFHEWDAYQLAKWDREGAVRLRDVLFLSHAKPPAVGVEEWVRQSKAGNIEALPSTRKHGGKRRYRYTFGLGGLWRQLIDGTLPTPDTWEVALSSSGADKKAKWERLLRERKLGYTALLSNLRNMEEAHVERQLVIDAITSGAGRAKVLPFRFLAAAEAAPGFAKALDDAMLASVAGSEPLPGLTYLVIDVSGSMGDPLSRRSQLSRLDAASGLAILLREVCKDVRVFTYNTDVREVPAHRGLALRHAIGGPDGGARTEHALDRIAVQYERPDRLILVTDEQAHDGLGPARAERGYLINIAPYQPGLDVSGGWHRVNGWSERIVDWIRLEEELARG